MKTRQRWFTLALLAALAAPAQIGAQDEVEPAASVQDPAQALEQLVARFNRERNAIYEQIEQAKSDAERAALFPKLPGKAYIPEFRALAEEAADPATAVEAWTWVLRLGMDADKGQAKEALEALLSDYLTSDALAELSGELRYASHALGAPLVIDSLRKLAQGSPHEPVQAGALFSLAAVLHEAAGDKAEMRAEARTLFERVIAEYPEVPYRDKTYGKAAAGFLYEMDHLQIGMVAPDFTAVDENGLAFDLSDYRGKVVVVDFWGFW